MRKSRSVMRWLCGALLLCLSGAALAGCQIAISSHGEVSFNLASVVEDELRAHESDWCGRFGADEVTVVAIADPLHADGRSAGYASVGVARRNPGGGTLLPRTRFTALCQRESDGGAALANQLAEEATRKAVRNLLAGLSAIAI